MTEKRYELLHIRAVPAAACIVLAAVLVAGAGCSRQNETYHFASIDVNSDKPRLKFYRVRVEASSFLCKSSYQAGLYDAEALHNLFGQVVEAKTDGSSTTQPAARVDGGTVKLIDENKRFAILYGANADTMADQISAFASNAETGDQIGSLLAAASVPHAAYEEAILKENGAAQAKKEAASLAEQLNGLAGDLEKPDLEDKAVVKILEDAVYASKRAAAAAAIPAVPVTPPAAAAPPAPPVIPATPTTGKAPAE